MKAALLAPRGEAAFAAEAALERLKARTRAEHEAIERNARLSRLLAEDFTLREYCALLLRLYGFHAAIEPQIQAALGRDAAEAAGLAERSRAAALASDVAAFQLSTAGAPIYARRLVSTAAEAWGALYVLEGSTLGGRIICKRLVATLRLQDGGAGLAYYGGHGPRTGEMWRAFRSQLADVLTRHPAWEEAVVCSARVLFCELDDWLAA